MSKQSESVSRGRSYMGPRTCQSALTSLEVHVQPGRRESRAQFAGARYRLGTEPSSPESSARTRVHSAPERSVAAHGSQRSPQRPYTRDDECS
jgi:hypothetical protein